MIKFREELIRNKYSDFNLLEYSTEFYSISTFRDLLFNSLEHTFTLPQIAATLLELNLSFAGFEFPNKETKRKFRLAFPHANAEYNLQNWSDYEKQNPKTFLSMYQFWVHKA